MDGMTALDQREQTELAAVIRELAQALGGDLRVRAGVLQMRGTLPHAVVAVLRRRRDLLARALATETPVSGPAEARDELACKKCKKTPAGTLAEALAQLRGWLRPPLQSLDDRHLLALVTWTLHVAARRAVAEGHADPDVRVVLRLLSEM
jgi:hypothetical protein